MIYFYLFFLDMGSTRTYNFTKKDFIMKKILISLVLLLSLSSQSADYKECIINEIKLKLESKDACEMETLKQSVNNVNKAYSICGLRSLENSPSSPDINLINTIAHAKYDDEIEKLLNEKIAACGFKGKAQVKDKGLSGSVEIIKNTKDKATPKPPPKAQ